MTDSLRDSYPEGGDSTKVDPNKSAEASAETRAIRIRMYEDELRDRDEEMVQLREALAAAQLFIQDDRLVKQSPERDKIQAFVRKALGEGV